MKKLLSILLSMLMMVCMGTVTFAESPTSYDLWINDVRITSDMMDNNGVIDSTKVGNVINDGTVSYTPASGSNPAKLRLNNATIEITEANKNGFYTEEEEIVIELIGNNSVSAHATNFALYGGNASFIGSGSLNVTNSEADAIYVSGNCTFGMSGTLTAISNSNLAIGSSNNINIEVGTGKIIAHGENSSSGAFYWGTNNEISGYKTAVGSTLFNETDERNMTTATAADGCFKVGDPGTIAKTVVLTAFPPDYLWFSASGGDVTLGMSKTGDSVPDISLEYSTDGQNWSDFVKERVNYSVTLPSDGAKVYIRNKDMADKISDSWSDKTWRFTMSGVEGTSVSVGGSIMSLLDKSASITEFADLEKSKYAFYQLFRECALLTDASELNLPAGQTKALPENCYKEMFVDCTALTAAPALPATKLGGYCYMSMFQSCESLETAPALPATEIKDYCYDMMFMGCENLKTAPLLPATKMANECYYSMFQWCENLETAPELPATELAYMCYYCMFNGCVKLTSAPELPATTLAESCYEEMFNGCEKLNYIKVGFSAWNDENDATYYWVNDVAPSGNFVCPETLDNSGHIDSIHGVPIGWTTNIDFSAKISGNVIEQGQGIVPNATVELYLGTTKIATTTTDTSGNYSFNNVEKGTYNIVVTKSDSSKTKTELVKKETSGTKTINVVLPASSVNSIVEYEGEEIANSKSSIKQTVVGGLDVIAAAQNPGQGQTITIKLVVKPMNEQNVTGATEIKRIAGNGKKVDFIDMSLYQQINGGNKVSIGDSNNNILEIVIPFDFTNTDVNSVMIIRKHGDNTIALNKGLSNAVEGEYFEIDEAKGTITIYAKRFSDYAIAYANIGSNPSSDPTPRYRVPNTGVEGTHSNNRSLLKLSSLSLLAISVYMVIKKKKDN